MKIQTRLEHLEFHAYHGIYPEEREQGGRFIVDVLIEEDHTENRNFSMGDRIIDYEPIFKLVKTEMEKPRSFIEEVAYSILQRLQQKLKNRNVFIQVSIKKCNPAGKFGKGDASVTFSA